MPITSIRTPPFKPPKEIVVSWNTWRKGLNTLLRENEIEGSEMAQADNLMLFGSGVPTKRWGSKDYYLSAPTGHGRFLATIKDNLQNRQVISMTDYGVLVKKSGTSYTEVTGVSWPSGYGVEAVQLGNNVYLTSEVREMARYDFTTLTGFATIAIPAGLTATNLSAASGLSFWSWRVTATSNSGGETIGSTLVSLASLPQQLEDVTRVRLNWTPVSTASGVLTGYNIYRGPLGDEVWVGGVDNTTTRFDDYGVPSTDLTKTPPLGDSTGGLKAKYSLRFQDRLIFAGIPGEPTKLAVSGRYPLHERFDWYAGGGYVLIEPDSEESITGLATYYQSSTSTQTVIVFKESSVWEVKLDLVTYGQYTILNPTYRLLTRSQGCSSHRSIKPVENDIMFANRKGVYILRYEPQLMNVINANEISAKVRPFFEGLTNADHISSSAAYVNKKYVLSFPNSKQSMVFDRERLSFYGPWTTPFGINQWTNYVDDDGIERWVAMDSSDRYVTEFSENLTDDKGVTINTIFKSRREDFGDWTIFKTINEVFMNFKSMTGDASVNIYTEDRDGTTTVAKTFTVSATGFAGTSGMGTNIVGLQQLGTTTGATAVATGELPRRALLYKSSRIVQIEIRTTGSTSDYELLAIKVVGIPQSRGNSPSSWNVTT